MELLTEMTQPLRTNRESSQPLNVTGITDKSYYVVKV